MIEIDNEFDPKSVIKYLAKFTKEIMVNRKSEGLLVIFSGQLDSYVTAKIAIETIGVKRVKLVILSAIKEKRREEIISNAVKDLKIPRENIYSYNVTRIMKEFEHMETLIPNLTAGLPSIQLRNIGQLMLKTRLAKRLMEEQTYSYVGKPQSQRDKFVQELVARNKFQKRLKMALAYLIAESENLLVLSKTNKTEWLTGLFTTWGYGHVASIMPLGNIYRTQVVELAHYLNIPPEIIDLSFSDIVEGMENKYQFFFELDSTEVDKVLKELLNDKEVEDIAKEYNIEKERIERVKHFREVSKYQRSIPRIP